MKLYYYMVSLEHEKDENSRIVFVTFSKKDPFAFRRFVESYLQDGYSFAKIRRISIIAPSVYEEYKEWTFQRSISYLPAIYKQNHKHSHKGLRSFLQKAHA